jgi:hypothetical protein
MCYTWSGGGYKEIVNVMINKIINALKKYLYVNELAYVKVVVKRKAVKAGADTFSVDFQTKRQPDISVVNEVQDKNKIKVKIKKNS